MTGLRRAFLDRDDSGLTAVELVIYLVLSVVVTTIVVTVFINTVQGQQQVTSVTQATGQAQTISQSIERALRNARAVSIENGGATLKVLTTLGDAPGDNQSCQAWRVNAGNLQMAQGAGFGSWATLATGVERVGGAPFFARPESAVDYALSFATEGAPVQITGGVVPRAAGGSLEASC